MPDKLYDFDMTLLEVYLQDNVADFGDLESMTKFSNGQSNPTYKLSTNTNNYVLRAKPPGKLLGSAHQVDREFRVMKSLATTAVAVPRMYHLAGEKNPLGAMFFVMEFIDGRILWDPKLPDASKQQRRQYYDEMNEALAALHEVDIAAYGLDDFGKPGNYFVRQTGRWIKQYRAAETVKDARIDRIIDWLNANMVGDDGQVCLVHGDYRLDNMVFATEEPKLIAILDWELSTIGHGLADLAYQCMQWRLSADAGLGGLGGMNREEMGIPSEADYVAQYLTARNLPPVENWNFYLIFGIFRLIAIVQGVIKRAIDGNASDPKSKKRMINVSGHLTQLANDLINQ